MRSKSFIALAALTITMGCTKTDSTISSDSIGGDGNLTTNAAGYTYSCYTDLPGATFSEVKVLTNDGTGVVTLSIKGHLPTASSTLTSLIPSAYKDSLGNISISGKFKNTSEGILDYTNSDNKPFVIINYSSNVGDKYVLKKSNGQTITRTVTQKSTTDDYPYGLMYIKTMTVEQDSRITGISKIRYIANHKFGLVGIEFVMEDGSVTKLSIM